MYAHLTENQAIVVLVMNTIMCPVGFFIGAAQDKKGCNIKYLLLSAIGIALGFLRMMQLFAWFGCTIEADLNRNVDGSFDEYKLQQCMESDSMAFYHWAGWIYLVF